MAGLDWIGLNPVSWVDKLSHLQRICAVWGEGCITWGQALVAEVRLAHWWLSWYALVQAFALGARLVTPGVRLVHLRSGPASGIEPVCPAVDSVRV